jgi:hypothetical protein
MMLVHISSSLMMILVVVGVGVVSAGGTAAPAPAFVTGHGHGRGSCAGSCAGHCAVTGSSSKCLVPALTFVRTPVLVPLDTPASSSSSSSLVRRRAVDNNDDDDDDGWGNNDNADENGSSPTATARQGNQPTSNSEERSRVMVTENRSAPEERDLFIPIFSIVSLAGLFGSYGYEMLRLYSRGELYLPWDHN